MARTFKDRKEQKIKHRKRGPDLKRRYRQAIEHGFSHDVDCEVCPDCGADVTFERGFLSCDECSWGSYFPEAPDYETELEFSNVA